MGPKVFPLRWESTGDQWWFASPIDWAAANGHYDLVKQLLQIEPNLLIKLTSLPRIRRLETVWDDHLNDVAECRSKVARRLLHECESDKGHNSLIRAGYGGWLLYTAASAGDLLFVKELLSRDPLLVFGEGEYGVTDVFYAAARSKSLEVFKAVFDASLAQQKEVFRWEMRNRAVHAAARGGAVAVLTELLGNGSDDVLAFRDAQGSTLLHSAAARGQIHVVEYLISSYNEMMNSMDDGGNTALSVAAYRGHLPVFKLLLSASPSSASLPNNYGDTFLHMAIAGFRTPSFRRLDLQLQLMEELLGRNLLDIGHVINVRNNDGRTALHMAVIDHVQSDVVELLLSVRCIDLNIRDAAGYTPLDLLYQRPRSPSSEILIKRIVSAGGVSDQTATISPVSHMRMHGIGGSPGSCFRIPDSELVLYNGVEESSCELTSTNQGYSTPDRSGLIESSPFSTPASSSSKYKKSSSINSAVLRLKMLLRLKGSSTTPFSSPKSSPIPLRQQFSVPSNKRILCLQGNQLPSPSSKKKFGSGLGFAHNVRQVLPKSNLGSPMSAVSESSWTSSPISIDMKRIESVSAGPSSLNQSPDFEKMKMRRSSFKLKMNDYLCFGGEGLAVENSIHSQEQRRNHRSLVDAV